MKKICIAVLAMVCTTAGIAQKTEKQIKKEQERERIRRIADEEEKGAIVFPRQTVFGIKLNTDGYGAFLELGRMKTSRRSNLYLIELGERKHPKEESAPSLRQFASSYVFGKINNFYYTKFGYGQQILIGNKGNKNGIAVSAVGIAGISLGLIKPYYIKYEDPNTKVVSDVRYNNVNDSIFTDPSIIIGATGFSKGISEIKLVPGAFVRAGLRFDYGRYNELVSAVEVGLQADAYSQKVQQMLLNKSAQLFFGAFVVLEFGSRK